jgi:hypothetical protein
MNQQYGYGNSSPYGGNDGNSGGSFSVDTVLIADPNENAFTIQMPRGWNNQAFLMRTPDSYRTLVVAQSPDNSTTLFLGDPHLPQFMEPRPDMYPGSPMAQFLLPHIRLQSFVPAELFFMQDLQQRYRQAPGFRITGSGPNPAFEQSVWETAQKRGMNIPITSVRISFEYQENGRIKRGILNGLTYSLGIMWVAEVSGVMTTEDPTLWNEFLLQMARSLKANPHWEQQQQMLHQQKMGMMQEQTRAIDAQTQMNTMNHQMRMQNIQQMGATNTQRWQAQQAQNDAAFQSYMNQSQTSHQAHMNSMREQYAPVPDRLDPQHQFINTIREENTVVDQSGTSYQVEGHHERYYVNKYDNTYIATDAATELHDLRAKMGVDPDKYEEVRIKK